MLPFALLIVAASIGPWTLITDHADFTPRDSASGAVFLGRMWLSSGYPSDIADLWSSTDGIMWTRVLDLTPYPVYSALTVHDTKLWTLGGSVWSSIDGVNWIETLDFDHRPFPWASLALTFDSRIWALGDGPGVWSSADGVNWTCATANAPYGNRTAPAVAVFNGKLWLMGGSTPALGKGYSNPNGLGYPDINMNNDVWSSTDGVTWTRVTDHAPWKGRMWFSAQSYAGRLWVMGGYDNDSYTNLGDTWYTTDGVHWQQVAQSEVSWLPRHAPTTFVFDDALLLAAGNAWPFQNDVWKLTATPAISTTTTVTASVGTAPHGQPMMFTAAVTPAAATGTVDFKDGLTLLGTVQLSSGTATLTTAGLAEGMHTISASYSGDTDYAASTAATQVDIVPVTLVAPPNFRATATSTSQVSLIWDSVPDASSYEILRRSGPGSYSRVGSSRGASFVDSGLMANVTYLYVVRALDAANNAGPLSAADLATTTVFTDDPIVPRSTAISAIHFIELREAVDAVLRCAGMPPGSYTDLPTAGGIVKAVHLTELRSNLDTARSALGLPPIAYTDPLLAAGGQIKAIHIQELQSAVK